MTLIRRAPLLIAACLAVAAGLRALGDALIRAGEHLDHDVWEDDA